MSLNLNKVIIAGRLCATPELKQTQSGISVASGRIAVNRRSKDGEEQKADFINFTCWRERAEFLTKYFVKGSAICVVGSLQTRDYTDQQGQKKYVTEIQADEINFVESKATSDANTTPREPAQTPYTQQIPPPNFAPHFEEIKTDDDLPF